MLKISSNTLIQALVTLLLLEEMLEDLPLMLEVILLEEMLDLHLLEEMLDLLLMLEVILLEETLDLMLEAILLEVMHLLEETLDLPLMLEETLEDLPPMLEVMHLLEETLAQTLALLEVTTVAQVLLEVMQVVIQVLLVEMTAALPVETLVLVEVMMAVEQVHQSTVARANIMARSPKESTPESPRVVIQRRARKEGATVSTASIQRKVVAT
ncbi:MAG: hypothetical protein K2Z81_26620 [Cyanobacteria bacterium]|nr:hypothetical protein [Cyanobacteriota bacterium]